MELNEKWTQDIKNSGADFVYFVDSSVLPTSVASEYSCAILFGKKMSKEYINTLRAGGQPKRKEVHNTERKMDTLAGKLRFSFTKEKKHSRNAHVPAVV